MAATVVFFREGDTAPPTTAWASAEVLRERGHRVIFVVEESFAGFSRRRASRSARCASARHPTTEEAPGQFWKDFIRDTAPVFRKPTIEQLSEFIEPTFRALCDGARYADERLREIFADLQPNVIVQDNVVAFPAIAHSGTPWARIASCNPLDEAPRSRPSSPATRSTTAPAGTTSGPSTCARTRTCMPGSAPSAPSAGPTATRRGLHPRIAVAQPLPLPR